MHARASASVNAASAVHSLCWAPRVRPSTLNKIRRLRALSGSVAASCKRSSRTRVGLLSLTRAVCCVQMYGAMEEGDSVRAPLHPRAGAPPPGYPGYPAYPAYPAHAGNSAYPSYPAHPTNDLTAAIQDDSPRLPRKGDR